TRLAAEDSMERRADLVLTRLERVARPTPGEQFFALCRVALCLGGAARQCQKGHESASDQLPGNTRRFRHEACLSQILQIAIACLLPCHSIKAVPPGVEPASAANRRVQPMRRPS